MVLRDGDCSVSTVPPTDVTRSAATRSGAARHPLLSAAAVFAAAIVLMPAIAIVVIAATGGVDNWPHLLSNVIPRATLRTLILLAGVATVTIAIGAGTAWLTAVHEFPGRRILDWALLLPLAVPTYVVAFAYLDLLHPIGPVQTAIRAVLGIESPRDFRLPDIRSLPGAILLFGFVLYPYVYVSVRALFLMQAATWLERVLKVTKEEDPKYRGRLLDVVRARIKADPKNRDEAIAMLTAKAPMFDATDCPSSLRQAYEELRGTGQ